MRRVSHQEIFISRFTISTVGAVISGLSQHAVINAAAVGAVRVANEWTEEGTKVDIAIQVAAIVSLTAFFVFSKNLLVFWDKDSFDHSFTLLNWLLLYSFIRKNISK